ncbi:DUF2382 domain-containing protein [Corynebacterium cystitidis]|uniref:Conserved domain-containing protein n=1 Tax=Corynebacterium cystitidis DSM 20524 TaxID=1121357 RepID=A0A1H9V3N2_9CORY|nr:PRC and DUF2382 domain-containing protein [Corynebacterium cystitidis]WJY83366.1 Stress response protein YsnF [Corynebacterium cystitidis DSM 20524]SES16198.1 conserved domain-containing protein [Corynebacterium cystitidis DSM 20524]SNV62610.1 Uncharacterized protein conserved in bacteria [Corynebacterium cystitidis]
MTNPNNQTYRIEDLATATAYDNSGDKLGSVKDVYINDATGQPDFVDVNHGLFNMSDSIVPLRGHSLRDGELHLAFSKDRIKDAPEIGENGHLTNEDQDAVYRHYGLENVETTARYADNAAGVAAGAPGAVDHERREAVSNDDATMIRSEERLNVDKTREETGRVSLRKFVEHGTETVEVPVEREEVRVERKPISAAEAANLRGQDLGGDEASVTLHEDRVNVTKESVPVEKVSLDKDVVRDTETVTEDVAKERIEAEHTDGVNNRDPR